MPDEILGTVPWEGLPDSVRSIPEDLDPMADGFLMAHQRKWTEDLAWLKIAEKCRRSGFTFAEAFDDTITAASAPSAGGENIWYIGDTKEKGLEFIGYCAFFARTVAGVLAEIEEFLFEDKRDDGESRFINAYRITFASGFRVTALASRPASIRGLQGIVVIDEAAFHQDVQGVIDACMALLIWGGKIRIISTHNGETNPYNELLKDARAGRNDFVVHRITFDQVVGNGLYERVCLVKGWTPSEEGKRDWYNRILGGYGTRAAIRDEELFCVPREGEGQFFPLVILEACSRPDIPVIRWAQTDAFKLLPDHIREAEARDWCERTLLPLLKELPPGLRSFVGQDFGRLGDLSVIWPLLLTQNLLRDTPFIVELRNVPFREQEQIFYYVVDRLPRFLFGALDARGNGHYLAERATQKYGVLRIAEVMLSQGWYREEMPPYKDALEAQAMTLPADADVIDDHRQVTMVGGIAKVPEGVHNEGADGEKRHGDSAIAAALAHFASRQNVALPAFSSAGQARDSFGLFEEGGGSDLFESASSGGMRPAGGGLDWRGWNG